MLRLIAQAGQRVASLPRDLGDAVAVTCGWQVRKADVEASAPELVMLQPADDAAAVLRARAPGRK